MAEPSPDFLTGMKDLLGMDEQAVNKLIDKLDPDSLAALTDAVAQQNQDAAENIVRSFDTDEDVNPLFRGGDKLDHEELEDEKQLKRAPKGHQFAPGDLVYVMKRDERGKKKYISATVEKPTGPADAVALKIDGNRKMVDSHRIYIEENVLGMVGVPELQRIQQLAGLAPAGQDVVEMQPMPQVNAPNDDAACQAMSALDTLEEVLPNVRLVDLKVIRQRLVGIQTGLNESFPSVGRDRKR